MYTGIVQKMLPIARVDQKPGLMTFSLVFDDVLLDELETGASVAVNGCCFTVTSIKDHEVTFDAIQETLDLTNIKYLQPGTQVNLERSAKQDVEVGGHILSGHIVGTARVVEKETSENNVRLTFAGKQDWMKYIFNKGFLAVNGCSLTVAAIDYDACSFSINLIPETLQRTNFSLLEPGDEVNIEIESQTQVIVDTVERIMAERYTAESQ